MRSWVHVPRQSPFPTDDGGVLGDTGARRAGQPTLPGTGRRFWASQLKRRVRRSD